MKRVFIFLSVALCALFAWSCEKNEDFDSQTVSTKKTFTFWAFNESYPTKTQLSDKHTQVWSPGDQILVVYKNEYDYFTTDITEPSASAGFQGQVDDTWELDGENLVYAAYPIVDLYRLGGSSYLGYAFTCYAEQQAVEGTFAPGLFPSMAISTDSELHFKNLFGGVVFRFSEGCEDFSAVTLHANNYGFLTGRFLYCIDEVEGPFFYSYMDNYTPDVKLLAPVGGFKPDVDYYMALPPYTFGSGFSLCFHKGDEVAIKRFTSFHKVKPSTFGVLKGMNQNLTWQSATELPPFAEEDMVGQWAELAMNTLRLDFGYTVPGKAIWIAGANNTEYDENNMVDLSLSRNIWGDIELDWNGSPYYLCSKGDGSYYLYGGDNGYGALSRPDEFLTLKYMGLWLEPEPEKIISLNGSAVGDRTKFQTLTLFKEIADNYGGNLPIVYIDKYGNEADYEGIDVTGKVVVVNRGNITFSEKIDNAYAKGAIGLIVVNNAEEFIDMNVENNDVIPVANAPLSARTLLLGKTSVPCYRPDTPVL